MQIFILNITVGNIYSNDSIRRSKLGSVDSHGDTDNAGDMTTTLNNLHQTLIDELEAATNQEQQLLRQEATINAHIDEAKRSIEANDESSSSSSSSDLQTKREETRKGLDQIEADASNVAFELHRLQETQVVFKSQVEDINAENCQTVEPEMQRLQREQLSLRKETDESTSALAKETSRLQQLDAITRACLAERVNAEDRSKERRIELTKGADDPSKMVAKQIKDIEKRSTSLKKDIKQLEERIADVQFNIEDTKRQGKVVNSTRRTVERDIETCTAENEALEQEARSLEEKTNMLKAQHHALATKRLEAEISLKKCNENLRHSKTVAALEKRQLDADKRLFVKKRLAADTAKTTTIPQLESNLQDSRASLATYEKQGLENRATLDDWKQRLQKQRMGLLRHQSMGSDMQNRLLISVDAVEEKEMQIEQERGEEKKLAKVIAVKQAQHNLLRTKTSQLTEDVDDVREKQQLQKLTALNLEKSIVETNKRCREFSTLHDIIKAERDSCTETIQVSGEAITELKGKVESLEKKLDQAKSESEENAAILGKEVDAHESSALLRDNLRKEQSRIQSLLREKNYQSERQEVQLKRIRAKANSLEREVKRIREQNEKTSAAQNLLVEQLDDRSSEIRRCSERSSLYQDSFEKGEAAIKERKDYIRMLTLECANLRRTVESTKRTMPDICMYRERISRFEEDLLTEKRDIEALSEGIEDPSNTCSCRARPLEGDDLETDQLIARLDVLEHRLHVSQNMLLDKEVTLEDISLCCRESEEQESRQNQEVTPLIQELTISRGRANDLSRTLISLMSELRMYQQSNLALTEDKAAREHALVVSRRALENGKPPSEEARRFRQLKESRKGSDVEDLLRNDENNGPRPRTNAYVPVDGTKAIPFGGAHAPFQPCVSTGEGHMRHYRAPRVLTIEEMEQQANEVLI